MTRRVYLSLGVALGMAGAIGAGFAASLASAQRAPESLLPPGFDDPAPTPSPAPAPAPTASSAGPSPAAPAPGVAGPLPQATGAGADLPPVEQLTDEQLRSLPSLEELEALSTEELDDLFGLKPKYDIPPAARRSLARVGVIARSEGGFPSASLAKQRPALVRAVLAGTDTALVSRWGHILMRRALASRLAAPDDMNPVEFAALRAGVLNRMGEYAVARALIQDVDTSNWSPTLADEALTTFVSTTDLLGMCPYVRLQGAPDQSPGQSKERAAQWTMISAICNAYAGEGALAGSQLDAAFNQEIAPAIDVLLARRFAGAAGRGQRAVVIEWDGVNRLNPWRFALANAVGEPVPDALLDEAGRYYARAGVTAAMLPLAQRAGYAARAGEEGILSARAMVDLYSEIYANADLGGDLGDRARALRTAYVAPDPATRITAMESLWASTPDDGGQAARVMTAYAAARIPPAAALTDRAAGLIGSMLSAGLDRDALAWKSFLDEGSAGWALVVLADPAGGVVGQAGLDRFADNDASDGQRASQFLIAGLAGLGRIGADDREAFDSRLSLDLGRETRWVRMIRRAAAVDNPALVALLAGLGMQGDDWSQMTPLHLYHIIASLRQVGLEAEARMIAAEAVARS